MGRDRSMDIAVTGMYARFPGSLDLDEWWSYLVAGQILTTKYNRNTLMESGISEAFFDDPSFVPVHGHLAEADRFDNKFFRVSPRDAELMDPQYRLMLEAAWSALEDAGYGKSTDRPLTGIFASVSGSSYMRSILTQGPLDLDTLEQVIHGNEPDFIASLIAYKLDLRGPAVAVQTACSSSLVGIHFAVQSLLNGDCDQALVVAAGISFPQVGHLYIPGGIKSASGVCRPFDLSADGVVEGSGVACVVLRRFNDAFQDEAELYGVILGTAINNDGSEKAGYFAPSISGEVAVIETAISAANIEISSIGYLETHGTGTHIGDPIEWAATSEAYKRLGAGVQQIAIGSVKANMGHLDAAAGLASLIKTLRVVKEGVIPPMAGFNILNSHLDISETPLFVPKQEKPWTSEHPRRAGISAFGIGGTNAHVIVEQPPNTSTEIQVTVDENRKNDRLHLIALSAADPEALARTTQQLSRYLSKKSVNVADVTFTLVNGRTALPERFVVCGHTSDEIANRLITKIGSFCGCASPDEPKPVIFLFPGQGSQYPGMALPFVATIPGFSEVLKDCLGAFEPILANRIRTALLDKAFPEADFRETELAQPALFVFQYTIAKLFLKLGISPKAMIGHSLGEITAACLAGALDLQEAANFVVARGKAMQACSEGLMLAVNCNVEKVQALIKISNLEVHLAAINTIESCVVAGTVQAIKDFQNFLDNQVLSKLLKTNRPFHSKLIRPAISEMATVLETIIPRQIHLPIVLNTTGKILERGKNFIPEYFLTQAEHPVWFADGLTTINKRFPNAILVEMGSGRTLSSMAVSMDLNALPLSPNRTDHLGMSVLTAIGTLWTFGHPVMLSAFCEKGKRIHLPTYPFFGQKWIAPEAVAGLRIHEKKSQQHLKPNPMKTDQNVFTIEQKPNQEISVVLATLWKELLGHNELNNESDFFELGGDSLLMVGLINRVNRAFEIKVSPREMMSARTIGNQVLVIQKVLELISV